MSFTLRGLQSGSVYEAIVQAKNRYGWNEVSGFVSNESINFSSSKLKLICFGGIRISRILITADSRISGNKNLLKKATTEMKIFQ